MSFKIKSNSSSFLIAVAANTTIINWVVATWLPDATQAFAIIGPVIASIIGYIMMFILVRFPSVDDLESQKNLNKIKRALDDDLIDDYTRQSLKKAYNDIVQKRNGIDNKNDSDNP